MNPMIVEVCTAGYTHARLRIKRMELRQKGEMGPKLAYNRSSGGPRSCPAPVALSL